MNSFKTFFNNLFGKHLFLTNVVSSSLLMGAGDAIEQKFGINENLDRHDWNRTFNMLGVGFLLGPLQHLFYKFIDERYPSKNLRIVLKKVVLDQTIASPIYIVAFFICCGILEQTAHQSRQTIKEKFFDIYLVDCCVWPPSQFINFLFINPRFRMLYINSTTMIYDVFLTHIKNKEKQ